MQSQPSPRSLSQNTAVLLVTNGGSAVVGFLIVTLVARGLGDAAFGRYSVALALITSLVPLAEFGLNAALTRDIAAAPERAGADLPNAIAAKLLMAFALALAVVLLAPALVPRGAPEAISGLRWGALLLLTTPVYSAFAALLRARQQMGSVLQATLGGQLVLLLGVAALLAWGASLVPIIAWLGIAKGLQALWAWQLCRPLATHALAGDVGRRAVRADAIAALLAGAWPFAMAGFVATLQPRVGTLVLGHLDGDAAVGLYAAANRLVGLGHMLPGALFGALLPALANAGRAQQSMEGSLRRSRIALLSFAGAAFGATLLFGDAVLGWIFGPDYAASAATLSVLTLALVPALQNGLDVVQLYVRGEERFALAAALGALALQVPLSLGLTASFGGVGAAAALLAAECALFAAYRLRLTRGPSARSEAADRSR